MRRGYHLRSHRLVAASKIQWHRGNPKMQELHRGAHLGIFLYAITTSMHQILSPKSETFGCWPQPEGIPAPTPNSGTVLCKFAPLAIERRDDSFVSDSESDQWDLHGIAFAQGHSWRFGGMPSLNAITVAILKPPTYFVSSRLH